MVAPLPASNPSRATERVLAKARELGFDAIGIADASLPLTQDYERYRAMLDSEMHGTMRYLAANAAVRERISGPEILAGAASVICLARRYQREDDTHDSPLAHLIARYARGRDYHNGLRKKIQRLAAFVRRMDVGVQARALCDEEPVLERAWAARAGLGFVGKNGMLIVPGEGSFVLLGEVVTTLALEASPPIPERCGACVRCLEACPTDAFVRPFVLDPRKCVAYLTIEQSEDIPEEARGGVGEHLFGCDDCQTICPYNRGHKRTGSTAMFEPLERWSTIGLVDLLAIDLEVRWREVSAGSPLFRAGPHGIARNAAIVLGNRRDQAAREALREAAEAHPSSVVRRAAAWGLERLGP